MPLVTHKPERGASVLETVPVCVDRHTLAKRRWRRVAEDGTDMAVDLAAPCRDGDLLLVQSDRAYCVRQDPEEVLVVSLPADPEEAARLGWFLGNQHLPVEVVEQSIRLAFEPLLEERLQRAGIHARRITAVFSPDPHSAVHHHHH